MQRLIIYQLNFSKFILRLCFPSSPTNKINKTNKQSRSPIALGKLSKQMKRLYSNFTSSHIQFQWNYRCVHTTKSFLLKIASRDWFWRRWCLCCDLCWPVGGVWSAKWQVPPESRPEEVWSGKIVYWRISPSWLCPRSLCPPQPQRSAATWVWTGGQPEEDNR